MMTQNALEKIFKFPVLVGPSERTQLNVFPGIFRKWGCLISQCSSDKRKPTNVTCPLPDVPSCCAGKFSVAALSDPDGVYDYDKIWT